MATKLTETLITAEELARKRVRYSCELVAGRIVRVSPAGKKHGLVVGRMNQLLAAFVARKKLGMVTSGESGFLVAQNPDTVRAPDLAFLSIGTLAQAEAARGTFFPAAPDLAVEVLSPDDAWAKIEKKVDDYLTAGSKAVWVVNPELETVHVYEAKTVRVLGRTDKIDGGKAVSGFKAPVKAFFSG